MKRLWSLLLVPVLALMAFSPSMATAQDVTTTVGVAETPELGQFLTDQAGMTLYIFTKDEPGVSNCYDDCEANWPVFRAEGDLTLPEGVEGELTQIDRTDGTQQVAFNGWPLYYWINDKAPGDTTGHEVGDVWYVASTAPMGGTPEASPAAISTTVGVAETPELGQFLVDQNGMTLYVFTNDTPGVSNCYDQCEANWPVFRAEGDLTLPDGVEGELTLIDRTDGTQQVAFNGWPLYYWVGDMTLGDTTGQGVGGNWWVANTTNTGTPVAMGN